MLAPELGDQADAVGNPGDTVSGFGATTQGHKQAIDVTVKLCRAGQRVDANGKLIRQPARCNGSATRPRPRIYCDDDLHGAKRTEANPHRALFLRLALLLRTSNAASCRKTALTPPYEDVS